MKNIIYFLFSILLLLASSCQTDKEQKNEKPESIFTPEYAEYFQIEYYKSYKKILILNPWSNENLNMEYYIPHAGHHKSVKNPEYSFIIKDIPKKVVALSSPMVGLMNLLDLSANIKGVSDPFLIYNEDILNRVKSGEIEDIGKSIQINMEKMIMLQPDLVIGSGWDKLSPDYEKMIQMKMTPVLMYDWQENHPLGKAEWMILLASFFNEEEKATALFQEVKSNYIKQKEFMTFDKQPIVFNGSEYQGIWYSAGGKSYMAQLIDDASGQYLMRDDSTSGSLMLDFEVLMHQASKADIWMYTGASSEDRLGLFAKPKYQSLNAVKKHKVYSYHNRMNENGANDYWETASFRPDIVLEDLIKIFHSNEPENLYYFDKVRY
ncbi:ABC transporter substrate-binding protein [Lentimicrobium sp. L6]|uniref:ABC transporter substrate-binding protein n=1 Tax=Lentimicrobium sp. L6 TaxID=2735916 RepID=UPI0015545BCE|nr:ABC transporter substrate-binding protein [Lentimicrobium sp. L6]NPD83515.1 ABC transporter substrate-binding protein [Lentimicrobium sp. L6]